MAKVTYLGHSCFTIKTNGKTILTDPFIGGNVLAKEIDKSKIKADYILVSHGHFDHVGDLIELAHQTKAKIICNWEIHTWLNNQGVENTHPMNIGGNWPYDVGFIKMVAAVHSSSLPDGTYGGLAAGFTVDNEKDIFYFAGDTALTYDMRLIAEEHFLDFAFLPIGDNFTMNIDDAVKAAKFIKCNQIIAMHFDTFAYIKIDHNEAIEKFAAQGIELFILKIGQTLEI
jgi:L-ascorbate metabolism protein UlaG (beta-lactamase superfamily)